MSSVLRRVLYMDGSKNSVRFYDFALVQTTLGAMVEPVTWNRLSPTLQHDPLDDLTRIDALEGIDLLREMNTKLGAGEVIHGGCQGPRRFDYNP